jgi:hypothetical protein
VALALSGPEVTGAGAVVVVVGGDDVVVVAGAEVVLAVGPVLVVASGRGTEVVVVVVDEVDPVVQPAASRPRTVSATTFRTLRFYTTPRAGPGSPR